MEAATPYPIQPVQGDAGNGWLLQLLIAAVMSLPLEPR